MFLWLRRWARERQRAIFRYHDGERDRAIDPLPAYRALMTHPEFDPQTHLKMIEANLQGAIGLKIALESFDVTLKATREVFGIREWSESQPGLTQAETRDLLKSFLIYCIALKKNGSPSPTGPEPGESSPSSASTTNTNASWDSPSIANASSCAAQPAP